MEQNKIYLFKELRNGKTVELRWNKETENALKMGIYTVIEAKKELKEPTQTKELKTSIKTK